MRIIAQIAVGLAYNARPEHRWRRVAVPLTAGLALFLLFAASSILVLLQREETRDEMRSALLATEPAPTDLFLSFTFDKWQGKQFPVYWIEPAGEETPVLPLGMPRLPEPGQAVVSPALDRLCERYPSLAARYPNRLVLGEEGLRSGGELIAFIRVQDGRTLANQEFPPPRLRGFGPPAPGEPARLLGSWDALSPADAMPAVIGFLVPPALLVLVLGVAAGSSVRDHRFALLHWLGATPRTMATLASLETALLALPGLGMAILLWGLIAPRLERLPLVGHEVMPGDLGLPVWLLLVETVGLLLVVGLIAAAMGAIQGRRGPAVPRPEMGSGAVHPLRAVPLGLATVLLVLGATMEGSSQGNLMPPLLIAGMVLAVVGIPLLLPVLLRPLGHALIELETVPALLIGRMLAWDPVRIARPFAAIAALIVLAATMSAYVAVMRHLSPPPDIPGPHIVQVFWSDPRPQDLVDLQVALDSGLILPVIIEENDGSHEDEVPVMAEEAPAEGGKGPVVIRETAALPGGNRMTLGTSCQALAEYFPDVTCDATDPYSLPPAVAHTIADHLFLSAVQLAPPDELPLQGELFVIDDAAPEQLLQNVWNAAMPLLPRAQVQAYGPGSWELRESPLVPWVVNGIFLVILSLTATSIVAFVDRYLAVRRHRQHLMRLGLTPPLLMELELWQFAAPYGLTATVSTATGLTLCCLVILIAGYSMPWPAVGAILSLAILIGLLGTASVALFGDRTGVELTRE